MEMQFQLRLPGLVISSEKIQLKFPRWASSRPAPFLIISRCSGLAVDTARHTNAPSRPIGFRPHGQRHQLWWLLPSGDKGVVWIQSVDNGLFLDAEPVPGPNDDITMRRSSANVSQRWRIEPSPDQLGVLIRSESQSRFLANSAAARASEDWGIWLDNDSGSDYTEWLIVPPIKITV